MMFSNCEDSNIYIAVPLYELLGSLALPFHRKRDSFYCNPGFSPKSLSSGVHLHVTSHLWALTTMASNSAPSLEAALDAAISRYEKHNTKSKALHEEAVKAFPGGNTRTVLHTSPFPVCIKSGIGYQLTSEDGDT